MKKVIYFAVVASVAFASCTKNEVRTVEDTQDRQITFQAVVHKASTKAGSTSTFENNANYPIDKTFGTFAYFYTPTVGFTTASQNYIVNEEVKYSENASGNCWTTDPAYYWPKQGYLTFYSYSPYQNTGVTCDLTNGITISSWDVDANQTVDVMIADRIDNQKNNTPNANSTRWNGVPTVFRHKLAQVVDFKLNTDKEYAITSDSKHTAGSKQFFVNEISLNVIKTNGKFVSGLNPGNGTSETTIGQWSDLETSTTKSYTWFTQEEKISTPTEGKSINEFKYTASGESYNPFVCPKNGKSEESGDYYNIAGKGYLLVRPQLFSKNTFVYENATPEESAKEYIKFVYTIRTWYGTQTESGDQPYSDEKVIVYKTLADIHGSTDENQYGWEINKRYTYEIKVSLDQIYWAPSVVDWEPAGAPSITF